MTRGVVVARLSMTGRGAVPLLVVDLDAAGSQWPAHADVVVAGYGSREVAIRAAREVMSAWPGAVAAVVRWPGGTVCSLRRLAGITAEQAGFLAMALGALLVAMAVFEAGEREENLGLEMR